MPYRDSQFQYTQFLQKKIIANRRMEIIKTVKKKQIENTNLKQFQTQ